MVANAIAYFLAAMFFAAGFNGFIDVGLGKVARHERGGHIGACLLCILLAWFAAYVGGI
ncbi:hypothetical protein [Sinorhizobium alkalisoli]|uniref:hypothetical protein n=1 Tax=Sinorhizobium alkalisoli TaxID=1752398 RepID=UPI00178C44D5|nr:hypothetical protein [Sinorhizobium alkalisoli]